MPAAQPPRIYFSSSIAKDLRSELRQIAKKMGASTVQRRNATHVIEYDPEVDGSTPSADEPEYCRTIAVDKQAGLAQVGLCRARPGVPCQRRSHLATRRDRSIGGTTRTATILGSRWRTCRGR